MSVSRLRRIWLITAQAVTILAALACLVFLLRPEAFERPAPADPLIEAARRAGPSVVTIMTRRPVADEHVESIDSNWNALPENSLKTVGSGVIVSKDGKILTNQHVVGPLPEILVKLADGRRREAKIVGTDPETDLAVLEIDPPGPLKPIAMGESARLQVGESVLAIGNPFSVGQSVTRGIVSALGRHGLGLSGYENFIQTDAAINRGNSGGPLVNTKGEMVGLNTAIFSPQANEANVGIGFAIPTGIISGVLPTLLEGRPVERGYLGVVSRELSPEYARDIGLTRNHGVMIEHVIPLSPAAENDLRAFDVIESVDESPVENLNELNRRVSATPPGEELSLVLIRGGERILRRVRLDERPPRGGARSSGAFN